MIVTRVLKASAVHRASRSAEGFAVVMADINFEKALETSAEIETGGGLATAVHMNRQPAGE